MRWNQKRILVTCRRIPVQSSDKYFTTILSLLKLLRYPSSDISVKLFAALRRPYESRDKETLYDRGKTVQKDSSMIVQYVILNGSILKKWSQGAIIAQACHACVASIVKFSGHPDTANYTSDDNRELMTKIILKTEDEKQFSSITSALLELQIDFNLWTEQPENIPTCIALRPYDREVVRGIFQDLKLLR